MQAIENNSAFNYIRLKFLSDQMLGMYSYTKCFIPSIGFVSHMGLTSSHLRALSLSD